MSNGLDRVELGLGLALGAGVLYVGYRLLKSGTSAASQLGERASAAVNQLGEQASAAVNVALDSSLQAGVNEWNNPVCTDPSDPACVKKHPGKHQVVDESGNVVVPVEEPADIKASGRSSRLHWGIEHENPKTILEALNTPGNDYSAEHDAFALAAARWSPDCADLPICKGYAGVMIWWGKNRALVEAERVAADAADLPTLQKFARGEMP